jgi:SAM-dependent methyltransferase
MPPAPPPELVRRYAPEHLGVFTPEELARFLGPLGVSVAGAPSAWDRVGPALVWELLYRVEPELYDRLVAGERLHPGILDWLPLRVSSAVEVGAGTGRLTMDLAPRCESLVAVEPAAPMRALLEAKLERAGFGHVRVADGFFERLPMPDRTANLVASCSAFTREPGHGAEAGLAEMLRVAAQGALVLVVWPDDPGWLVDRGFQHVVFPGEMCVEFRSEDDAEELAELFYPEAAEWIARKRSRRVPYEVLGVNAPRDLCWRRA